ncbi:TetR/AcrR family transcriptional regulator [Streptomyces sp. NPDC012825]|uniref:TetR/AcrR family transcriptional regulator n=1 Tax=Streptomyces sp. NPDC012825 TaxID=3364851 RepID=UPI00368A3FDD
MGHEEDLLEGAKHRLLETGCGRTTPRDAVAASGTDPASTGHHYGSGDALLQHAFLAVIKEWGERVGPVETGEVRRELPTGPYRRFHTVQEQVIDAAEASRPVGKLQTEVVTRLDDEKLRDAIKEPRRESHLGTDPETGPERPTRSAPSARPARRA